VENYTEEEAIARRDEVKAKWNAGEEIYLGFTFDEADFAEAMPTEIRYNLRKAIENDFICEGNLANNYGGFISNSDYIEMLMVSKYFNTIKILDNFNYEVGQNYSPFEVPSYLDTLDFECIEKTDTYVKLIRKAYTGDKLFVDPAYADSISLDEILEITKTEDGYSIVFTGSCGLGTITNVITLN